MENQQERKRINTQNDNIIHHIEPLRKKYRSNKNFKNVQDTSTDTNGSSDNKVSK